VNRHPLISIFSYTLSAFAWLVVVFFTFEVAVRMLGLNWRILDRRPDAWVGTMYPKGTIVRWGKEGFGTTRYVRDGEIATPYDEGMEVLVLGDSHSEGWQVDDRDKYVSIAEELLWQRHRRVNLKNYGLGGLSFADEVYRAGEICRQSARPSPMVIQVSDNSFFASFDPTAVNYFRKTEDGSLELVHHPPDPAGGEWLNPWWTQIRLFDYLQERWWVFFRKRQVKENPKVQQLRATPPTPDEIAASVVAQARLLTEKVGDTPVIFLRAPGWPYDDPKDPATIAFRALPEAHPWPIVDPGKELARLAVEEHIDPRTFANGMPMSGHLNRYGDRILGRMLADKIEQVFFSAGGPTDTSKR
jgi:hypothetical protein